MENLRLRDGVPSWVRAALNCGYASEVMAFQERKLRNNHEAWHFIVGCLNRKTYIFDHWGQDAAGNLVCEPYADANSPEFLARVHQVANRLGTQALIRKRAYHAPECVRVTFCCSKCR
jgi:hypothetical protein